MNIRRYFYRATRALVLTAAIAGACAVPAFAQPAAQPAHVSPGDRAFVSIMLQESRDQLALARLAKERATGPEASTAAKLTIAEWSSLRKRLVPIAYEQGAPVRGTLDARQQTMLERLGRTPTAAFDTAYLRDAQRGNQLALTQMRREGNTIDPNIRHFLAYARPLVSSDEQMTSDDISDR